MFHRGWFLVSVREPRLAQQLTRIIAAYGVASCELMEESHVTRLAEGGRWAGCIADGSPDTLLHLASLRARAPALPLLVVLDPTQWDRVNAWQGLHVEVGVSPVPEGNLVGFVQRAFARGFLADGDVAQMVARLAADRGLTAREVQLLAYCLGNEPRERVRRRLGICENTLKTQVRGLLRKCGARSVDGLAKNVLRAALLGEKPPILDGPTGPSRLVSARSA
jgi:DNA-binding NarL/FixJ family response regulator